MRLIDADDLIAHAFKNDISYKAFVNLVKKQQTIEERRRGEWIDEGFYADFSSHHAFCCSECGNHLIETEMIYKYCPFCGARMEGADADT